MKIKVTIAGETHEVEQSNLELGELQLVNPSDPPKGLFNQEGLDEIVKNRVKGLQNPDELIKDADFQKKVLSKFDITLDESGKPKGIKSGEDDEAKFKAWFDEHVTPKDETIDGLNKTISSQNSTLVDATIEGLVGKFLDPKAANNPYIKKGIRDSFKFDAEAGKVVPVNADGNPLRKGNADIMNAEDWFTEESKTGSLKDVAIDNRNRSSGFQTNGEGNVITISESDAKDHGKYQAAEAQAKETGAELKIQEN